jgi:RNA polymerase sigma-70 factor (ECF subfamily)
LPLVPWTTAEERGLPFEAFVYRIAAHKLADVQRTVLRAPTPVAEVPDAVDDAPGPEARAVTRAHAMLALELMEQLSTQQREILTLRVAVGLSTEETAASLRMTPGAVRVAQHRALAKLRGLMAERDALGVA